MRYFTILFTLLFLPFTSLAQDTLRAGHAFETELLELDQTKTYVHYQQLKDGRMLPRSMKTITVSKTEGQFSISQKEYTQSQTKTLETVVDAQMLTTDTHVRTTGEKRESYKFTVQAISGIPDDQESINKDFQLELTEPTYNFEIDFTFLQSIDWSQHTSVIMNFYHPGGSLPPANYTFTREREEILSLASGMEVDTWVIFTDYNGQPPARFWVSKDTNEVIRQKTDVMELAGYNFVKQLITTP
ncbi:hypothetical protein [Gracilimonas sp.]|uniref:hypothetical protein n=1 Tax=Gracilimonas sp. TaxID=1974203 RepID=UPI003D0CB3FE